MEQVEYTFPVEGVALIRMNRPERLNAMGQQMLGELAEAWNDFQNHASLRVAILTGTGRAFCVGEDLKEAAERGSPGLGELKAHDPYWHGELTKPTIAAVNGWAIGGGVALTTLATLRVASRSAIFEYPQVRHWGVGAFQPGVLENLPVAVAAELAFGFRVSGQRAYEMGWVNRCVDDGTEVGEALKLAEHLLTLRPRTVTQTIEMLRKSRPMLSRELQEEGAQLRVHGVEGDIMETRRAFVERSESKG